MPIGNGIVQANLNRNNPYPLGADSTTPLAAGGVYSTAGKRGLGFARFRGFCFSDTAGTLYVEQSADNTTFRPLKSIPVAGNDAVTPSFDEPIHAAFVRARFVNGGVAQTSFSLSTMLARPGM